MMYLIINLWFTVADVANEGEMKYRIACCRDQKVPITDVRILIARITGIL